MKVSMPILGEKSPLRTMSKQAIIEYTASKKQQYQRNPHKQYRSKLLDEFCQTTQFERKYAQNLLSGKRRGDGQGRGKNAGRKIKYDEDTKEIIKNIWMASEQPCGKRLKTTLELFLPSYEEKYGKVEEIKRSNILSISAEQLDRILKENKSSKEERKEYLKGRSKEAIRKEIPIRAEGWQVEECGWLEVDCVALCGGDMSGGFIWILTITDVWSGWTEIIPMWNRSAKRLLEHYGELMSYTPFEWKGLDSDNGGEFIS